MAKNCVGKAVGEVFLTYQNKEPPSDADWDGMLETYRALPRASKERNLVYTEGGAPNVMQRGRLVEVLKGIQPLTAVVTPSMVARTVGIAIRWFNPKTRMFSPSEMDAAFAHIQATPEEQRALLRAIDELRALLKA
jgi:hypothetical protein